MKRSYSDISLNSDYYGVEGYSEGTYPEIHGEHSPARGYDKEILIRLIEQGEIKIENNELVVIKEEKLNEQSEKIHCPVCNTLWKRLD